MREIFNIGYALEQVMAPLSQEEIWNTPEYFAMSRDQILKDPSCPRHLWLILTQLPLGIRPDVIQVRPQDFRPGRVPHVLGTGWHVDVNTSLANGRMHLAKNLDEFRSTVVSFGDVAETEFIKGPITLDTSKASPFDHSPFATYVASQKFETVCSAPNQVATYTSRDIHRVAPNVRPGKMRLIIVTFECDEELERGAGERRPSLRERDGG